MQVKINLLRHFLFWSWNIIFVAFIYFGFMPIIGSHLIYGLEMGTINNDFIVFFLVILLVPILSSILGFIHLRSDSKKLLFLMYGFELPLLFLSFFRVFFLRDTTPGVIYFLLSFTIGSAFLLLNLSKKKDRGDDWFNLSGNTILLWCGLWVFCFLVFLLPPTAWKILFGAKQMLLAVGNMSLAQIFSTILSFFFVFLGAIFFLYTSTLFVFFPFMYVSISIKSWYLKIRSLDSNKRKLGIVTSSLVLILNTGILYILSSQNHSEILSRLDQFDDSEKEKKWLVENESEIRKSLLNIYLSPYRYMGDETLTTFIQELYAKTFNVDRSSTQWIQKLFNIVASPLIYKGTGDGMSRDQANSEKHYKYFFDAEIQERERPSIRHAVQATYSREQIDAGLINIGQERVFLESQHINIEENGEWSTLELMETYLNPYSSPEEVYYSFYLPQGAVIAGLWLSDTPEKKYEYQVASRGAAQKVYKQIVRTGADPALIEQVGPQLYRLRVFPILPNGIRKKDLRKMYMWLKVKMMKNNDKEWELPIVTEKRNIYWNNKTEIKLNGVNYTRKEDEWLPKSVPYLSSSKVISQDFQVRDRVISVGSHESLKYINSKIAVVVDTSFSLRKYDYEIKRYLKEIGSLGDYDLYTYDYRGMLYKIEKKQLNKRDFFGSVDSKLLLKELATDEVFKSERYDQLIVLTDKTSFLEKENNEDKVFINHAVWFAMIDGRLPRVSGDNLMDNFYKNGGGVTSNLSQLMTNIKYQSIKSIDNDIISITDRYIWKSKKAKSRAKELGSNQINSFAAQEFIKKEMSLKEKLEIRELDKLQFVAKEASIVTPYSSMIVLVDDLQKQLLKNAEKENSRFHRDEETGKELLSSPKAPFEVTAVPEPEEWALIIIAMCILLFHVRKKGFRFRFAYETMRWWREFEKA